MMETDATIITIQRLGPLIILVDSAGTRTALRDSAVRAIQATCDETVALILASGERLRVEGSFDDVLQALTGRPHRPL